MDEQAKPIPLTEAGYPAIGGTYIKHPDGTLEQVEAPTKLPEPPADPAPAPEQTPTTTEE